MSPARQNRFSTPFTPIRNPSQSLRRLRTAFSPSRATARSASPDSAASDTSSTGTMSPLTFSPRTSSPADSHRSSASSGSIRDMLRLRRQPSVLEVQLEEERHLFGTEVECLEPRLSFGERNRGVEVGIFEVLNGRA